MSTKKRVAEFQLTKEADAVGESADVTSNSTESKAADLTVPTTGFGFSMYSKTNPFAAISAGGVNAFSNSTENLIESSSKGSSSTVSSGFGAYANSNPFAAVTATSSDLLSAHSNGSASSFISESSGTIFGAPKTTPSTAPLSITLSGSEDAPPVIRSSSDTGSGADVASSDQTKPSSFDSVPSVGSSFSSYTTKAPFAVVIPSPHTLSPKGQNPFSNPSPKHNPFVTIVESKDNLWSAASRSSSGTRPGTNESSGFQGSSSFPFPSSTGTAAGNTSTSDRNSASGTTLDIAENKGVFGSHSKTGDSKEVDEEDAPIGDDEHSEEQVYGKVYPMPDNVTVVTGEENEECVIQVRAKLFRLSVPHDVIKSDSTLDLQVVSSSSTSGPRSETEVSTTDEVTAAADSGPVTKESPGDVEVKKANSAQVEKLTKSIGEWIEVGIGPVRILKQRQSANTKSDESDSLVSKRRMVMRREDKKGGKGTKLLLNMLLEGYISVKKHGDRTFHITCIGEGSTALGSTSCDSGSETASLSTYMFQTKQPQEADKLFDVISHSVTQDRKASEATSKLSHV